MKDMLAEIANPSEGCQPPANGESFKFEIWRSAHRSVQSLLSFCNSLKMSSFCGYCDPLHFNISIWRLADCISGTIINCSHFRYQKLVSLQVSGYRSGFAALPHFLRQNRYIQCEERRLVICMLSVTSALLQTNLSFVTSLVSF